MSFAGSLAPGRRGERLPFPRRRTCPIFGRMAKSPRKNPKIQPNRRGPKPRGPPSPATPDALADLLNPAINKGTAGLGSGTGDPRTCSRRRTIRSTAAPISPPRTRRANRRAKGFGEAPQRDYEASPITGLDPALANELGLGDDPAAPDPHEKSAREAERIARGGDPKYRLPKADLPQPGHGLSSMGVAATADSLERLLREGRPEISAVAVDAASAAAPGEIRRRQALRDPIRVRAEGRPARGDPRTGRRRQAPRPHAGAAGRHRLRQDLHHGQGDRGDAAPRAHPRAEQDFGRAALRRVQVVLPRQRGGIFRLLLRLLPAGSLRAAHRHLHREGILDQRADRPHAPFGDARAARARRRRHRRLGVVHLRHRLGRDLFGHDLHAEAGRQDRAAPVDRRPGGAAIQAHAGRFLPRLVPRARRRHRDLPGALRGPRLARLAVRRRDRVDPRIRPAHRAKDRRAGIRQGLRQFALRHAAPDADPGDRRHQARARRPPRPAQRRRPPAGGAAAGAAHACSTSK